MTWHRPSLLILLSALLLLSVRAAESVRAFPGAGAADLTRGTPSDAFRLRLLPQREVIEGYNFWIQFDDGATMIVTLIVSNLGQTNQPAVAVSLYPTNGSVVEANQELPPASLSHSSSRVLFGRNSYERLSDGRYRLRIAAPLKRGGGELTADLTFEPTLPGYQRGDGKVHFGDDGRRFELQVLYPLSRVSGRYSYQGKVANGQGRAYGDHSSQNLWAHHIADRWFNYRFFSPELFIACTSFVTPPGFGRTPVSQVLVARSDQLLLGTGEHTLQLNQRVPDTESGYAVPREVRSIISGEGMRLELSVPTDRYLHRIYMLEDLNPFLRAFIRAFIARPYVYRYRTPATVQLSRAGVTSRIPGIFVGELIFVNE